MEPKVPLRLRNFLPITLEAVRRVSKSLTLGSGGEPRAERQHALLAAIQSCGKKKKKKVCYHRTSRVHQAPPATRQVCRKRRESQYEQTPGKCTSVAPRKKEESNLAKVPAAEQFRISALVLALILI